jgi:hypothetical protein
MRKPILVRPLIDHINDNLTLLENEYLCEPCNGWGRVMNEDGEIRTIYVQCPRCLGEGKLDWVENVVGKLKKWRMVEPGVYVQETDFSTYVPLSKKEEEDGGF